MIQANPPETRDFDALDAFEGAFDWWREAGVDADFSDEASGWLAEAQAEKDVAAPPPPPPPKIVQKNALERALDRPEHSAEQIERSALPDSLEKFREWWMSEASLADGVLERRVPPRGVAGAKVMLLLPQPFDDDREGLLTGGAGTFVRAMLGAMGIGEHEAYFATALPAPMAMPEWDRLAASGLGEVARHHIALAVPERVILFGRTQLALFGKSPADAREPLTIDCAGKTAALLPAPDLRNLARSARRRETFWNRWLDWTA